jgi:hypothetical protein
MPSTIESNDGISPSNTVSDGGDPPSGVEADVLCTGDSRCGGGAGWESGGLVLLRGLLWGESRGETGLESSEEVTAPRRKEARLKMVPSELGGEPPAEPPAELCGDLGEERGEPMRRVATIGLAFRPVNRAVLSATDKLPQCAETALD